MSQEPKESDDHGRLSVERASQTKSAEQHLARRDTTHFTQRGNVAPPLLVALVGVDCGGKTTQLQYLEGHYRTLGVSVKSVRLQHKPTVRLLLHQAAIRCPSPANFPFGFSGDYYSIAYYCDFVRHYHENIEPLLRSAPNAPSIVLSDRYTLCYKAYAEAVRAESPIAHSFLDAIIPPPDLYLCLDLNLDTVKRRMETRKEPASVDETDEILTALIRFYRASAREQPLIQMINADQSREAVLAELVSAIDSAKYAQHQQLF